MQKMSLLLEAAKGLLVEVSKRIQQKPMSPMVGTRLIQQHKLRLVIHTLETQEDPAQELKNMNLHRFSGFVLLTAVDLGKEQDLLKIPQVRAELAMLDLERVELSAHGVLESKRISGEDFL